jgi:putative ABC transport system permease protein
LLLLAPALLLLSGALLVLRLIPLGASLGARGATRNRGFTAMLAFAQVERSPNRYARMTLLLVLAVGLGLFAVTFDASLAQNADDRAAYVVGADVRLDTNSGEGGSQRGQILAQLARLPGVQAVSPAYRSHASTTVDEGDLPADVLGVDPATFATVGAAAWRSDYADAALPTLLRKLGTSGTSGGPVPALVSTTFATQLEVQVGDRFSLQLPETAVGATSFVVAGVVGEFPTLYPAHTETGFIVLNLDTYLNAILANTASQSYLVGPNEFWLKTSADASQRAALLTTLRQSAQTTVLDLSSVTSLDEARLSIEANPVGAGIRGLLVVGAVTAALLAVLGSVMQSLLAARQRARQFAILRTLGTSGGQLTALLLSEQGVVYLFGLVGGTLLGLLLTTATLPFLQFSDTAVDASQVGVPPYQLVFSPGATLAFYAALLVSFALALLVAARYAATIGLGKALRLGED